jgi:dephospho-CoA kinase
VRRIGITGGFGTGKSTVSTLLRTSLKAACINADFVCRRLLEPDEKGWAALKIIFGDKFFLTDGSLDRILFRSALFKDDHIRLQVNELLHPLARKSVIEQLDRLEKIDSQAGITLVEVPLLYEAGWEDIFHSVIVVYADCATCLRRIMERDGVNYAEAEAGFSSQMPLFEKVLKADHVIDNSGNMIDTQLQVAHLARALRAL